MEGDGGEHETWEPLWSARCSPATSSAGSVEDVGDDLDEQSPPADAEDKVFVAVPEDVSDGKSTLLWALHNLIKDGSKLVIAHVHSPAQEIAKVRGHTSMKPEEIKKYIKLKREKEEKNLDAYVFIAKCTRDDLEVGCEKVIVEMDNVAKGLDELISLHSITKLVMGAAADQHYSKDMDTPKSMTALQLMEIAAPSCKIWFTCKGQLICTREENENLPAIPPSSAESSVPLLPAGSISNQMRSMALTELEYEVSRPKGCTSSSLVATEMTAWDYFFGDSHAGFSIGMMTPDWGMREYGSSKTEDAVNFSRYAAPPLVIDATNELTPLTHSPMHESGNVYFLMAPACNKEEEPSVNVEMCDKLQDLCTEAKSLEVEGDKESNKLYKTQMDLLSALQRVLDAT